MVNVMVACKLPHGLHLEIKDGPLRGRVTVKGYALPHGVIRESPLPGGFALTPVDEAFYNEWARRNQELDVLKKGFVFSASRIDAVRGRAEERADLRNGFEPMDPNQLPVGLETVQERD